MTLLVERVALLRTVRRRGIRRIPQHGTWNEYANHKCRCEPCRQAAAVFQRNYHAVPCANGCGKMVWGRFLPGTMCRRCRATSVRDTELECGRCREWKPDDGFQRNRQEKMRRGRHRLCRVCSTITRREYRQRTGR
jgi:hypothetical protein